MGHRRRQYIATTLLAGVVLLLSAQAALATGTTSGTSIDNSATVDYEVGGVAQTQVPSNTASFLVDNMIDLTVTTVDGAPVQVVPGDTSRVLTYTVTNDGNTVQDYSLTAQGGSGTWNGATDNFDATGVTVFVDSNSNGTYEPGVDTAAYIDELADDATITVFIVGDIPPDRTDGDGALYDLIAQTAVGGASGAQGADITSDDSGIPDDPSTVETVFADAAGTADAQYDGQHSSTDAYQVVTASLGVVKSSTVVSDPINGATNPKAIPGATVRYTITLTNSGSADADNVVMVDPIPTNATYASGTITLDAAPLTDAVDADAGDYNGTNPGAVTVTIATLSQGGGSAAVTFDVTVD